MTGSPPILAGAADAPATVTEAVPLDQLPARDLGRLAMGFHFVFWGELVALAALCESLTALTYRLIHVFLLAGGSLGLLAGTWRLHQVTALGDAWRHRTRDALVAAALLAYLCPFLVMWRHLPANLYLLVHALAWLAVFIYMLTIECQTVAMLGRLAGRRGLVLQAILFGSISVVVLFPPFALFSQVMVMAARNGRDPLGLFQFWFERFPLWIALGLLLPFSLTLSLVWAAKDLAQGRLLADDHRAGD